MTRREKILILLDHYLDVLNGMRLKDAAGDDGPRTMGPGWNHPSYRRLEKLRKQMRDSEPFAYWHLAETYFRSTFVRVAYCPKCETEALKVGRDVRYWPASELGKSHNHKPRSVDFQPRMRRVVNGAVRPEQVSEGVDWLEATWGRNDPSLPDEILAVMARGEVKEAA